TQLQNYINSVSNTAGVSASSINEAKEIQEGGTKVKENASTLIVATENYLANPTQENLNTLVQKAQECLIIIYRVAFDSQGGSKVDTIGVKNGEKVTKPTDPTWENHTFIGWYSTQNVADTAGKQFDFNSVITKDITLYGFWKKNVPANCLPGLFSVGSGKQVYFTRSNLYWDGSALKFEANQTDYQTSWNANHVSHFYWTKTLANSYAESYSDGTCTVSDKFFADGSDNDHKLTVEGTSGLYVLSKDEWKNLLGLLDATAPRANANSLYKNNVTVGGVGKCLIIAPDDYDYNTNQLKEIYTLAEVNNLGLVCLPPAGYRKFSNGGVVFESGGQSGFYCFSVPDSQDINQACRLYFSSSNMDVLTSYRNNGQSVRAVCAKN
ncbi:MAG TPA: hypothetical protein DDY68_05310, partial [Porphyromonadaceae bacterium]|nr:hypothetical protein [Porphyromonadaceae bacterium]